MYKNNIYYIAIVYSLLYIKLNPGLFETNLNRCMQCK